jgi:cob(I)alamin adenosyltransferase
MQGLVHIYTGNGKGKTTAAIGLGIRACGRGMKVLMVQFLKGGETGEMFVLERLKPDFEVYRNKEDVKFTWKMNVEEREKQHIVVKNTFQLVTDAASSGDWDMIILDEIMVAIATGFISAGEVVNFVKNKPVKLELVLTGRNAPEELIQQGDYVSEIQAVKHPMSQGIRARKGIEY